MYIHTYIYVYIPITFKTSEDDIALRSAAAAAQVYTIPSSSKVTLLTMTPIVLGPSISIVWLGVLPVTATPPRLILAVVNTDTLLLSVNNTSQLRVTASPTHASDGVPISGCRNAVKNNIPVCIWNVV